MTEAYEIVEHSYDVVIVGAGGGRTARGARNGKRPTLGEDEVCHFYLSC
jgi:hypothetical protein